jgi:hypothetical protein
MAYIIEISYPTNSFDSIYILKYLLENTELCCNDFKIKPGKYGGFEYILENKVKVIITSKKISVRTTYTIYNEIRNIIKDKIYQINNKDVEF